MLMVNKLDFAPYYLEAERKLKEVHEMLKLNKFAEASTVVDEIVVELRMMRAAIRSHAE
jgi:hypothetical protein